MSHDFCRDHLGQYLDQSLDQSEREKVESHLQTCAECAQIARGMAGIRATMRDMTPFVAPPQLRKNVRAALQNEGVKTASRPLLGLPLFGLRLPQLAWSGSLALGALLLIVLARPLTYRPIIRVESDSASSAALSSAPPNRIMAPKPVGSQSAAKPLSAPQRTSGGADQNSKPSSNLNSDRTGNAVAQARSKTPISPAREKESATEASSSLPGQNAVPVAPDQPQAAPGPSRPREEVPSAQPAPPRQPNSDRQSDRLEQMPRPATAKSAAPATASAKVEPSAILGRAAPAPTADVEKPQLNEPRMSRSRPNAGRQTTPATALDEGAVQPQILRRRVASAARGQLPAAPFSFQLRAMPAPVAAPSTAPADAVTDSAAPNAAPMIPAPSNAASPRAAVTRAAPPRAMAGAMSSGAAPQSDGQARLDALQRRPDASPNAPLPQNFAPSTRAQRAPSASIAPKIAASESRDTTLAREAPNLREVRRFKLQVRATRAEPNARIRIEAAAPVRLLWPQSGVVWNGNLAAGTPVEIEFSLGGVRGGEKISVVLEQKLVGAPSRIIETRILVVPPTP